MTSRILRQFSGVIAAVVSAFFAAIPSVPCAAAEAREAGATTGGPALDPGTGSLYWRSSDGLVPLPALAIDADLRVTGLLVQGTVRQTFRNTSGRTIEALYVFPLPERASVDAFEMRLGDRVVHSEVRERDTARAAYEAAKQEGRRTALLEFTRKGLFRTSIAGIAPDEEIAVTLRYFDEAEDRDGGFALALPLTWRPRYRPGAERRPDETFVPVSSRSAPAVEVRVAIEAGHPVAAVRSASHPIRVNGDLHAGSLQAATLPGVPADRDFRLEWTLESASQPRAAVFLEEREDGPYGLVMIVPPDDGAAHDDGLSTATLFVVDVSGSMEGPSLAQAKRALLAALDALRPGDSFNLLKFSDGSAPFRADYQPATPSRLDEARDWIRGLEVEGGTEILAALRHAQALVETAPERGARRVILITDGAADADDEAIAAITRGFGDARLHAVGIGPAPNRPLMRSLARRGRGACEFIGSLEEVASRLDGFLDRLRRPVLTDLVLDWNGVPPLDVRPSPLPDLYAGEPLVLSFRAASGPVPIGMTLRGATASGPFSTSVEIAPDAPRGAGLGARWARARIEDLLDGLAAGSAEEQVREAVVPLALEFGLVTPYTSRVAIEERITYRGATPVAAANALPGSAGDEITLPGTGTLDPLWLRCGLLLIAAGLMFVCARRWLA
ncbi:MAG TPA: VIT domain-containing protein [Candidatus Polarisedimenticolia bacterium]|nr:VIT domain-containing protein [Candidatus Polarisedimenticolia bacterium]